MFKGVKSHRPHFFLFSYFVSFLRCCINKRCKNYESKSVTSLGPLWLLIYIKNKSMICVSASLTDLPGTTSGLMRKLTQETITNMKEGR